MMAWCTGRLRQISPALVLIFVMLLPARHGLAQRPTAPLATVPPEHQAQQHCPADVVVGLNLPTAAALTSAKPRRTELGWGRHGMDDHRLSTEK